MRTIIVAAMLALLPLGAIAEEQTIPLAEIVAQQAALREAIADQPDDLTPRQVGVIRKAQDEFFRLVDGKSSLDQFPIHEKVKLENLLERINAQLVNTTSAQSDKQVCWRERTTGGKTMSTRCGSQQEIDEAREGARTWLAKPKVCVPPGCG